MPRAVVLAIGAFTLILSGCFGGPIGSDGVCAKCPTSGTTVTSPMVPSATAKVLSITILPGTAEIRVGDMAVFSLQTEMSAGIPPPGPPPSWETDSPAVATVDSGRVTALAPGQVTLSVRFREASATRLLKIIP
jgi:hypothetical protein